MRLQIVCMRECIVTLAAFEWLFSSVRFQMCFQIACLRGCKVTLVAFLWLFSTVRFQMCPQIAFLKGCKLTLVAFFLLFFTLPAWEGIITLVALVWPHTSFRHSHKNFDIVIVSQIFPHHYHVGNEEKDASLQHYRCIALQCLEGTDFQDLFFIEIKKVKVKFNAHTAH